MILPEKVTAAYFGMISYLDYNIGKLIDTLNKTGLIENTYMLPLIMVNHGP